MFIYALISTARKKWLIGGKMRGLIKTYKKYRIYDTYTGYVIYNDKGTFKFSTKWGLPVIEDLIDELIMKEAKSEA